MWRQPEALESGEHLVGEFRPHWRHALVPTGLFASGLALLVSGFGAARATIVLVVSGLVGITAAITGLALLVDWFTQRAIVTTSRIIDLGGAVGASIGSVAIRDVRSVRTVPRSGIDRLLRSPTVEIETEAEIVWFSVEHPLDMAGDIVAMIQVGSAPRPRAA